MGTDVFAIRRPVGYPHPLTYGVPMIDKFWFLIVLLGGLALLFYPNDPNAVGWQSGPALGGD